MDVAKLNRVWYAMIARCEKQDHPSYRWYGAEGISVCPEWIESFEQFAEWSRLNGYEDGLQIDRIDTTQGYSPSNCRWTSCKVNNNNRRDNLWFEAFGESKTSKQWFEDERCVVPYTTFLHRIQRFNWDVERALTTPSRKLEKR